MQHSIKFEESYYWEVQVDGEGTLYLRANDHLVLTIDSNGNGHLYPVLNSVVEHSFKFRSSNND